MHCKVGILFAVKCHTRLHPLICQVFRLSMEIASLQFVPHREVKSFSLVNHVT